MKRVPTTMQNLKQNWTNYFPNAQPMSSTTNKKPLRRETKRQTREKILKIAPALM